MLCQTFLFVSMVPFTLAPTTISYALIHILHPHPYFGVQITAHYINSGCKQIHIFRIQVVFFIEQPVCITFLPKSVHVFWSVDLFEPMGFFDCTFTVIDLFTDSDAILKILSVDFCGKVKVNSDSSSKTV